MTEFGRERTVRFQVGEGKGRLYFGLWSFCATRVFPALELDVVVASGRRSVLGLYAAGRIDGTGDRQTVTGRLAATDANNKTQERFLPERNVNDGYD